MNERWMMVYAGFCVRLMLVVLCMQGLAPLSGQQVLKIEKLSSRINSANYDETNPVLSRDGKTLYFTRVGHPGFKRTLIQDGEDMSVRMKMGDYDALLKEVYEEITEERGHNPHFSPYNQDIWIARSVDGEFDRIEHPDHPVNNALPNSVCSLSPLDNELIIVNEFYADGSMYKGFSRLSFDAAGVWQAPKPMHIYDLGEYGNELNLFLSDDGELMLLSLEKAGGYGKNDLYVSFRVSENKWSAPKNLGADINTDSREITPFLSWDMRTLYFASDRPGGPGGSSIYVSRRLDDSWQKWTKPELIEAPVNSSADDAQPFLNKASGYLYFSSTREGDSNIYRVKEEDIFSRLDWKESEAEAVSRTETPVVEEEKAPVIEPKTPAAEAPFRFFVHCSVVDAVSGTLIPGASVWIEDKSSKASARRIDAEDGECYFSLDQPKLVRVEVQAPGFITAEKWMHPEKLIEKGKTETHLFFYLDALQVGAAISLAPIYFERSKAVVLESSFAELDKLYQILKAHPGLEISIEGHTDHVGELQSLIQLSSDRANAIKVYLVQKGIAAYRIKTVGHGPNKPVSQGNEEDMRSKNRRVEVIISGIEAH